MNLLTFLRLWGEIKYLASPAVPLPDDPKHQPTPQLKTPRPSPPAPTMIEQVGGRTPSAAPQQSVYRHTEAYLEDSLAVPAASARRYALKNQHVLKGNASRRYPPLKSLAWSVRP